MSPEGGISAPHPHSEIDTHAIQDHGELEGAENSAQLLCRAEAPVVDELVIERRQQLIARAKEKLEEIQTTGKHSYLRAHQLPGYASALQLIAQGDAYSNERHAARLIAPTGSGKSATIVALALDLGVKTLLVTSRNTLIDQFKKENFPKFAPELPVEELSGRSFQGGKAAKRGAMVEITNYQFLASAREDRLPKPGEHDLYILDEGHRTLGFVVRRRLDQLEAGAHAAIATTATEAYSPERTIAECYPVELDKKTMADGIKEGYLSGIQVFCATTGATIDNARSRKLVDYTVHEVAPLRANEARNKQILDCVGHALTHADAPVMVECIRGDKQSHAVTIAQLASEMKHPQYDRNIIAEAIGTHRKDSQKIIEQFKAGEIDVLTTVDMGTEGSDYNLGAIVCGAPHKSLLKLEQFMGRGMRQKKDPLLCYQLVDSLLYDEDLALCWDVLGVKEPVQGLVILAEGQAQSSNGASQDNTSIENPPEKPRTPRIVTPDSLPESLQSFPGNEQSIAEDTAQYIGRRTLRQAVSAAQIPVATDGTKVPLSQLVSQTGISNESLMRVLFDNAYAMGIEEGENGTIEPHYPKEASLLLEYLVAEPDDIKFPDAAKQLGIDHQKLAYQLDIHNITPPRLYPRQEQHIQLMRHLKPWQMKRMAEIVGLPRPIDDHEIALREVASASGCIAFGQASYFEDRGIQGEKALIAHERGNRHMRLYDRTTMLSYVAAYRNAPPLPSKTDYKKVAWLTATVEGTELHHVFAIANELGITARYYRTGGKRREEFFTNEEYEAVAQKLPEFVRSSLNNGAGIPPSEVPAIPQPIREQITQAPEDTTRRIRLGNVTDSVPLPISESAVQSILYDLGITPENDSISNSEAGRLRAAIIARYAQEEKPTPQKVAPKTESQTAQPSALPARPQVVTAQRPQEKRYPYYVSRDNQITEARKVSALAGNRHPHVLIAIAHYHPHFQGEAMLSLDDTGRLVTDLTTYNRLFIMIRDNAIPAIPLGWVPAPSIARHQDIALESLEEWLKGGGYPPTHLQTVTFNNKNLYFCSPQLARTIVDNYQSYRQRLAEMQPDKED